MQTVFTTGLGDFAIEATEDGITKLHFPGYIPAGFQPDLDPTPLLRKAEKEVREFIAGKRKIFTLPLKPCGSGFMLKVWERLLMIGYGELLTYGAVAREVGSPGAARAVGVACRNNPIPLIIPCHRVIGANGRGVPAIVETLKEFPTCRTISFATPFARRGRATAATAPR